MTKREYICAAVLGIAQERAMVVLSLAGPRGGTRAIEALSLEQAVALRGALDGAIERLLDAEVSAVTDGDYAADAEHAQRIADAREGFDE